MSDAIRRIQASIEALHGGERDRATKYENFLAWQIRIRQQAKGQDPSSILKARMDEEVR